MESRITRRELLKRLGVTGIGLMVQPFQPLFSRETTMRRRKIPSSGEEIPVVGLGTWIQFDVGKSESERRPLREVLRLMAKEGGKVIDSSPMYGRAETVIGDLTADLGIADEFFYATKVWTTGRQAGISQMETSMRRMRRDTIDLMQVHNLLDWQTHLLTLKDWREQGRIRYIGVTHHTVSSHSRLEEIVKTEDIDFVQFNYSIRTRSAERNLLNTAREHGVAVLVNEPYEGGSLFGAVGGRKVPTWAEREYDINSWGQFFLKYILSHPAVTCVIPGTSNPEHLVDNMGAGYGRLPDEEGRERMVDFMEDL
ncbi:aldo/keto reductase [Halalkalibaculum sp. DA384]|uniref:aldo/keto reductase n=1 Tax=Halalkalibaculum sp. DA384 TaxID=3373606 RepID=UPI0037546FD5